MSSLPGIKQTLDAYITANYKEVRIYTNHLLERLRVSKKLELLMLRADTVINNAYLHVVNIDDPTATENTVKSYLLNTIKMQIFWSTSVSHLQERVNSTDIIQKDEPDDLEILDKLKHEDLYNLRMACVQTYLNKITNPVEKRIAEAYFKQGRRTSRAMAELFDIPNSSAYYMIKAMKQKIRDIEYSYRNGKDK